MSTNQQTNQILKSAIAGHIRDTADELLYWIEELKKLASTAPASESEGTQGIPAGQPSVHWAEHLVSRRGRGNLAP
jgi:hypothetical protein